MWAIASVIGSYKPKIIAMAPPLIPGAIAARPKNIPVKGAPVAAAKSNPDHAEEIFEDVTPVTAFEAKPEEEEV